ncbi:MAG: corrinoid protein [Sphingomonadaceae bacterium]|nr:corrinoid protein [Sphingomonadaceae bacterium]
MGSDILQRIADALIAGEDDIVATLTEEALAAGMGPQDILDNGLIAGMTIVGGQFKRHEIFLPDVLMSAKAMKAGTNILQPLLLGQSAPTKGRIVLGTVQGDLHDIGKNLAAIMLRGRGFDVIDLGKDIPALAFVDAAEREGAQVIGMSALLTTTMPVMKQVIDLVRERGLAGRVKTVVGGAPITPAYAASIGADVYVSDAASAADRIATLFGSL